MVWKRFVSLKNGIPQFRDVTKEVGLGDTVPVVYHVNFKSAEGMLLASYLGLTPAMLEYERGPGGKPRLRGEPLQYNLSHSDIRVRLYPLLSLPGLKIPYKRQVLRALDLYSGNPTVDFEDALSVAAMMTV